MEQQQALKSSLPAGRTKGAIFMILEPVPEKHQNLYWNSRSSSKTAELVPELQNEYQKSVELVPEQ